LKLPSQQKTKAVIARVTGWEEEENRERSRGKPREVARKVWMGASPARPSRQRWQRKATASVAGKLVSSESDTHCAYLGIPAE